MRAWAPIRVTCWRPLSCRPLRRWSWPLLLYPVLGAAVGLLVHPQFPDNLAVWWFQSVEYFRFKASLDVGTEIRPNFTDVVLMVNLGWFVGLAVLWRSTRVAQEPRRIDPQTLSFAVGAAAFGLVECSPARRGWPGSGGSRRRSPGPAACW